MACKIISFFISLLFIQGCSSSPTGNLGLHDNQLQTCPSSPNCVSSFAGEKSHYITPIRILTESAENTDSSAQERLLSILKHDTSASIIINTPNYLHVEFKSAFLGFIDDTEFYFSRPLIHIRSASRLGYSDLGVNRRRLESIRELFEIEGNR